MSSRSVACSGPLYLDGAGCIWVSVLLLLVRRCVSSFYSVS